MSAATLIIRDERGSDHTAIRGVIDAAFLGMPYAAGDEAALVETLRADGALTVSLVAELDAVVVGHIAFSPARALDPAQAWYALGPVAVLPAQQRTGIGSKLVRAGLERIAALGAAGCILTGNPAYYARFGFEPAPANAPAGEPAEFFMVKRLGAQRVEGPVRFHPAFDGSISTE